MGVVKNITYDTFPRQKNLGDVVNIGQGKLVPAIVVRYDDEAPHRAIFKTTDGRYFEFSELNNLQLPQQGDVGNKAQVCFHFDTRRTLEGRIVRDDLEEPYKTLIELEDGRVVDTVECQYSPIYDKADEDGESEKSELPVVKEIELLKKRMRRKNYAGRAKILHEIYKQLVPSRKGKLCAGPFSVKYSIHQKGHTHLVQIEDDSQNSLEQLAQQIITHLSTQKFARFLVDEMRNYQHLQNHADRVEELYLGASQVDMLNGMSAPIMIKKL